MSKTALRLAWTRATDSDRSEQSLHDIYLHFRHLGDILQAHALRHKTEADRLLSHITTQSRAVLEVECTAEVGPERQIELIGNISTQQQQLIYCLTSFQATRADLHSLRRECEEFWTRFWLANWTRDLLGCEETTKALLDLVGSFLGPMGCRGTFRPAGCLEVN